MINDLCCVFGYDIVIIIITTKHTEQERENGGVKKRKRRSKIINIQRWLANVEQSTTPTSTIVQRPRREQFDYKRTDKRRDSSSLIRFSSVLRAVQIQQYNFHFILFVEGKTQTKNIFSLSDLTIGRRWRRNDKILYISYNRSPTRRRLVSASERERWASWVLKLNWKIYSFRYFYPGKVIIMINCRLRERQREKSRRIPDEKYTFHHRQSSEQPSASVLFSRSCQLSTARCSVVINFNN